MAEPAPTRSKATSQKNFLSGNGGADLLSGMGGNDTLDGGDGDDFLNGGQGKDVLDGGPGFDTAIYSEITTAVVVFLDGASNTVLTINGAIEDQLRNVENIVAGTGNDVLVGDSSANHLNGSSGEDFLFSTGFENGGTMKTGAGNDTLDGGDGNDGLFAGDGNDTLKGGPGSDGMVGGAGDDALNGGDGPDLLFGGAFTSAGALASDSGEDALNGGGGDDRLWAQDGNDTVSGDSGDDVICAGAGDDVVDGGDGNDYILAEDGADTVADGLGFDYMYGGAGADTFVFKRRDSADWIIDFKASEGDRLRLEGFGYGDFTAVPLLDLSTPGHAAVQLTVLNLADGSYDQLTIFGVTLVELSAANVLV